MAVDTQPITITLIFSLLLTACNTDVISDANNKIANAAAADSSGGNRQSSRYSVSNYSEIVVQDSTESSPQALPSSSNNSPLPPISGNWGMVFEDNFSGNSLNPDKWRLGSHHLGIAGIGGNSSDNVVVRNGNVELVAKKEPTLFGSKAFDYSGAEISTYQKFNQAYGYFEAKIKYDAVRGVWPSFWIMPDRGNYGKPEHHHESFIRFNIDDYTQPVTSALLKIRVTEMEHIPGDERRRNKTNYNLSVHKLLSDNWDESTITWNNKPAYDPLWFRQVSGSVNGPDLINELSTGEDIVIDITDYVNEQIVNNRPVGLALVDTFRKQKKISLGSKESDNYSDQPRLEIDGNILTATDDSYVRSGIQFANVNYGNEPALVVKTPWDNTSDIDDQGMEIDIMESLGMWGDDKTQHAMHWDYYGRGHPTIDSHTLSLDSSNDGYHVYGMNWQPGHLDFYIDGVKTWEYDTDRVSSIASYMLLSQQVGGWAGNANIPDDFGPATVYVDYVRVWSGSADD